MRHALWLLDIANESRAFFTRQATGAGVADGAALPANLNFTLFNGGGPFDHLARNLGMLTFLLARACM